MRADTALFWSAWGRRGGGKARQPMAGKTIWRLCKTYGRLIGYPDLKPHDLRHGVAHARVADAELRRDNCSGF